MITFRYGNATHVSLVTPGSYELVQDRVTALSDQLEKIPLEDLVMRFVFNMSSGRVVSRFFSLSCVHTVKRNAAKEVMTLFWRRRCDIHFC